MLCFECGGRNGLTLQPETLGFLQRIGRESVTEAAMSPPAARTLRQVEELCAQVRRSFLQHELRSYEVMRQTLGSL